MLCGNLGQNLRSHPSDRSNRKKPPSPNPQSRTFVKPKDAQHYAGLQDEDRQFIPGNELLTLPSALEAMATITISLLTTDVKTRKLIVSKETLEAILKSLNFTTKVSAK